MALGAGTIKYSAGGNADFFMSRTTTRSQGCKLDFCAAWLNAPTFFIFACRQCFVSVAAVHKRKWGFAFPFFELSLLRLGTFSSLS